MTTLPSPSLIILRVTLSRFGSHTPAFDDSDHRSDFLFRRELDARPNLVLTAFLPLRFDAAGRVMGDLTGIDSFINDRLERHHDLTGHRRAETPCQLPLNRRRNGGG